MAGISTPTTKRLIFIAGVFVTICISFACMKIQSYIAHYTDLSWVKWRLKFQQIIDNSCNVLRRLTREKTTKLTLTAALHFHRKGAKMRKEFLYYDVIIKNIAYSAMHQRTLGKNLKLKSGTLQCRHNEHGGVSNHRRRWRWIPRTKGQ